MLAIYTVDKSTFPSNRRLPSLVHRRTSPPSSPLLHHELNSILSDLSHSFSDLPIPSVYNLNPWLVMKLEDTVFPLSLDSMMLDSAHIAVHVFTDSYAEKSRRRPDSY